MNKVAIFVLGLLTGAAGCAGATYYILKTKFQLEEDETLADMESYYEERYQSKLEKLSNPKSEKLPEEKIEEKLDDRDDELIKNNKGVKKYHHENGLESAYGSARIFGNDAKPKKEDKKVIKEISEQEFLNAENGYEKQTVDVWCSNDDDEPEIVGIWAYETDNEELVDKRFGKTINELLDNREYDELMEYCHSGEEESEDDGIGVLYLKNDDLHVDFEFIIHDSDS